MSVTIAQLWRHPIKGIGAEALEHAFLTPGRPLPGDRSWAVAHAAASTQPGWQPCRNFLRGAASPQLMAITAETLANGHLCLRHPQRDALQIDPTGDEQALLSWLAPLWPADRPAPTRLVQAPPEGMSDAPFASVSVLNMASLRALSQRLGVALDTRRFRGNIWLQGLAPWEEFDLIGKTIQIGDAQLHMREPITRCRATEANPDTGLRDAATLDMLQSGWGHSEFGVYAEVITAGQVCTGDAAKVV
jgi:uncharacterized protein YcbX